MFTHELTTTDPDIRLIKPNIDRDAPLSVQWVAGDTGRTTLGLMGVPDADNRPSTLEEETALVQSFLDNPDQYNWMIQLDGRVIGTIWADLKLSHNTPAPSVSIMIGDPASRGRGVGRASLQAVMDYLHQQGHHHIYARHLTRNTASAALLHRAGFVPDGQPYTDPADGVHWQNVAWSK